MRPEWQKTIKGLGGNTFLSPGVYSVVVENYKKGDGRAYHNILHIDRMISVINQFVEISHNPSTLKAAVFGHDLIYNPGSATNELESADSFDNYLGALSVERTAREEVKRLIRITEDHKTTEDDIDGKLLIDADFAILGSENKVYTSYSYGIYTENVLSGKVPLPMFKEGRMRYINGWIKDIENNSLFLTPKIRDALQPQALDNLLREKEWVQSL